MPPAAPVRPGTNAYHFHTYSFAGAQPFQPSIAQPAAGNLQFYSMVQDLAGLVQVGQASNVPNIALTQVGGATVGNRRTQMLSFGNQGNVAGRRTVVITGGIHAREWIATEMAYLLAEYLIVNYPAPGAPLPLTANQTIIQNLVDRRNIRIIPMVNPDGNYRTVFGGDRMWRKNRHPLPAWGSGWIAALVPGGPPNPPTPPFTQVQAWTLPLWAEYRVPNYDPTHHIPPAGPANYRSHRIPNSETGVDLNRNMATTAWGYDCAPNYYNWDPSGDTYFGTRPGGEAETSNVQQAMAAVPAGAIAISIDYHAFGRMILYPSEAGHTGLGAEHIRTGQMLQALIVDQLGAGGYSLGTPITTPGILYDATGSIADYAAQQHQARAFTIELDPVHGTAGGFVLPQNQIQAVFEKNIRGALAAIAAPVGNVREQQIRARFQAWNVSGRGNQIP
jgi:hypothetical protein